mgnify:CR=1 FL=1
MGLPSTMPIASLMHGSLTIKSWSISAGSAATWNGRPTIPVEAFEMSIAIRIDSAYSLANLASPACLGRARLVHSFDVGGVSEGEKRYGYRQEGTGRTPPYISHFVRRWYPSGRDST